MMTQTQTDNQMVGSRTRTYAWALCGVFGAIHLILTALPYSITVGTQGFISLGVISGPVIGYLLGPFYGTLAVLIGSILGTTMTINDLVMRILTPFASAAGAWCAGMCLRGHTAIVLSVYVAAVAAFLFSPPGLSTVPFLWFHVVGLLLLLLLTATSRRAKEIANKSNRISMGSIALFWVVGLCAVMFDHMIGCTTAVYLLGLIAGLGPEAITGIFLAIALVYPIERTVASMIIVLVLVPTSKAFKEIGFDEIYNSD